MSKILKKISAAFLLILMLFSVSFNVLDWGYKVYAATEDYTNFKPIISYQEYKTDPNTGMAEKINEGESKVSFVTYGIISITGVDEYEYKTEITSSNTLLKIRKMGKNYIVNTSEFSGTESIEIKLLHPTTGEILFTYINTISVYDYENERDTKIILTYSGNISDVDGKKYFDINSPDQTIIFYNKILNHKILDQDEKYSIEFYDENNKLIASNEDGCDVDDEIVPEDAALTYQYKVTMNNFNEDILKKTECIIYRSLIVVESYDTDFQLDNDDTVILEKKLEIYIKRDNNEEPKITLTCSGNISNVDGKNYFDINSPDQTIIINEQILNEKENQISYYGIHFYDENNNLIATGSEGCNINSEIISKTQNIATVKITINNFKKETLKQTEYMIFSAYIKENDTEILREELKIYIKRDNNEEDTSINLKFTGNNPSNPSVYDLTYTSDTAKVTFNYFNGYNVEIIGYNSEGTSIGKQNELFNQLRATSISESLVTYQFEGSQDLLKKCSYMKIVIKDSSNNVVEQVTVSIKNEEEITSDTVSLTTTHFVLKLPTEIYKKYTESQWKNWMNKWEGYYSNLSSLTGYSPNVIKVDCTNESLSSSNGTAAGLTNRDTSEIKLSYKGLNTVLQTVMNGNAEYYVIVHEICHIFQKNQDWQFKTEVTVLLEAAIIKEKSNLILDNGVTGDYKSVYEIMKMSGQGIENEIALEILNATSTSAVSQAISQNNNSKVVGELKRFEKFAESLKKVSGVDVGEIELSSGETIREYMGGNNDYKIKNLSIKQGDKFIVENGELTENKIDWSSEEKVIVSFDELSSSNKLKSIGLSGYDLEDNKVSTNQGRKEVKFLKDKDKENQIIGKSFNILQIKTSKGGTETFEIPIENTGEAITIIDEVNTEISEDGKYYDIDVKILNNDKYTLDWIQKHISIEGEDASNLNISEPALGENSIEFRIELTEENMGKTYKVDIVISDDDGNTLDIKEKYEITIEDKLTLEKGTLGITNSNHIQEALNYWKNCNVTTYVYNDMNCGPDGVFTPSGGTGYSLLKVMDENGNTIDNKYVFCSEKGGNIQFNEYKNNIYSSCTEYKLSDIEKYVLVYLSEYTGITEVYTYGLIQYYIWKYTNISNNVNSNISIPNEYENIIQEAMQAAEKAKQDGYLTLKDGRKVSKINLVAYKYIKQYRQDIFTFDYDLEEGGTPGIYLEKIDGETGDNLVAEFTVSKYNKDENIYILFPDAVVTKKDGKIKIDGISLSEKAKYIIKETKAPTEPQKYSITTQYIVLEIDPSAEKPVKITVYIANNVETTGAAKPQQNSDKTVEELKHESLWSLLEEEETGEIIEENTEGLITYTIQLKNYPDTPKLKKVDETTNAALSGAEFTVYKEQDGKLVSKGVNTKSTDSAGYADLSEIFNKKDYYTETNGTKQIILRETTAPKGYSKTDAVYIITMDKEGKLTGKYYETANNWKNDKDAKALTIEEETGAIIIKNKTGTPTLELTKVDSAGNPIKGKGGKFQVKIVANKNEIYNKELTLDKNGKIKIELTKAQIAQITSTKNNKIPIKITVIEIEPPEGYTKGEQDTFTFTTYYYEDTGWETPTNVQGNGIFTATNQGALIGMTLTNENDTPSIKIIKTDINGYALYDTVTFTITETKTKERITLKTNKNETTTNISNLPGIYDDKGKVKDGTYTFTLIETAPRGYEPISTVTLTVTIKNGNITNVQIKGDSNVIHEFKSKLITLKIKNDIIKRPQLQIVKHDSDTGDPISNVKFIVSGDLCSTTKTLTSGKDGKTDAIDFDFLLEPNKIYKIIIQEEPNENYRKIDTITITIQTGDKGEIISSKVSDGAPASISTTIDEEGNPILTITINNTKKTPNQSYPLLMYIKGDVWLEKIGGKDSNYDGYLNDNDNKIDTKLAGIKVAVIDEETNSPAIMADVETLMNVQNSDNEENSDEKSEKAVIHTEYLDRDWKKRLEKNGKNVVYTDKNGEFEFYGLNPSRTYRLEFTYNGMIYAELKVTTETGFNLNGYNTNQENSSKAKENTATRANLKETFREIGPANSNYWSTNKKAWNTAYTNDEVVNAIELALQSNNGDYQDLYENLLERIDNKNMAYYIKDCQITAEITGLGNLLQKAEQEIIQQHAEKYGPECNEVYPIVKEFTGNIPIKEWNNETYDASYNTHGRRPYNSRKVY